MGECFHWFDTERALAALHRVVQKSNGLVAIWGYRYPYFVSKNLYEDCVRNNEQYLQDFDKILYDKSFEIKDEKK